MDMRQEFPFPAFLASPKGRAESPPQGIHREIPADRDIEPTPDSLEVKITPKEIVLFNDGDEVDRIPAEAFDNIDDVDFKLYENDAEEAVLEEEDIYDWQDDYYEE